jgi:hypothetical protein
MTLPVMTGAHLPRLAYAHGSKHDPTLTLPEKFRPVTNSRYMPKPEAGGLWTAPVTRTADTEDGEILSTTWTDWCRTEDFGRGLYTDFLEIQPDPYALVLRIDSLADLRRIHLEYGYLPDGRFPSFAAVLDWEDMALDCVGAVYLTDQGQADTRFPDDGGPSLYGWDVSSVLWLQPKYRVVMV